MRTAFILLASVVAMINCPASVSAQSITFSGGTGFDGLRAEGMATASGQVINVFLPSKSGSSPLPANIAPAVAGIVQAYIRKDTAKFSEYLAPHLWSLIPPENRPYYVFGVLDGIPVTPNTPYYLGVRDGTERVRVEWVRDGRVAYLSYLQLIDGRITQLTTNEPVVPPVYNISK